VWKGAAGACAASGAERVMNFNGAADDRLRQRIIAFGIVQFNLLLGVLCASASFQERKSI
jgi:hypothetical protein